jgi:hypothetical protein
MLNICEGTICVKLIPKISFKNIYGQVPQPVFIEYAPNFNSIWNKLSISKNCYKIRFIVIRFLIDYRTS